MATNNAVNADLSGSTGTGSFVGSVSPTLTGVPIIPTPFTLGATSVTATGTQLNFLTTISSPIITKVIAQTFSSNSTYTPTAGMVYCIVELQGPGGGGGGSNAGGAQQGVGGGGGSGAYCRKVYTAANIGASAALVLPAGGLGGSAGVAGVAGATASCTPGGTGVVIVAGGGAGGGTFNNQSAAANAAITGGAGGTPLNGDLNIPGQNGSSTGAVAGLVLANGSMGGGSIFGSGTPFVSAGGQYAGNNATGFGAGGGGSFAAASTNSVGGNASGAFCFITEYVSG